MASPFEIRRPAPPMPLSEKIPAQNARPAQPPQDRFLSMLRENGLAQDTPSAPLPSAPAPQTFPGLPAFGQFAKEPIMPPPRSAPPALSEKIPAQPRGQLERGNIDLGSRPVVRNPDGSVSTIKSISVNIDGQEVLIPTIADNGKQLSDDEAIRLYDKTGRHLGKFDTPENATEFAKGLSKRQGDRVGPGSALTPETKFVAGEPGAPKSGLTVHQLAKDEGLQTAVSKWFRTTGKQAIKGPDLMALLKEQAGMDMSVRQAAGLARRLTQAETLRREDPARAATRKGAARAMKKEG